MPPSFTKKLSETVEETEGNSIKLEGRVAGSQPLIVSWSRNNQEVQQSVNSEISFKNNVVILQIKKSNKEDAGLYTCKVSNEAGSALCTSSVLIKGLFLRFVKYYYKITTFLKNCKLNKSCCLLYRT